MSKIYRPLLFTILFSLLFSILAITFFTTSKTYAETQNKTITLNNLESYENINLYGNYIVVSNKTDESISIYNKNNNQLIKTIDGSDSGNQDGKLTNASLTALFGDNIYIYCPGHAHKIYNYSFESSELVSYYNKFNVSNTTANLDEVTSLTTDSIGDVFAIGKHNEDYLFLKKPNSDDNFTTIAINILLDSSSKILVSYSEQYIFIVTTNNIYKLDTKNYSIVNTFNVSNSFIKANIDNEDNIYLLESNSNTIKKLFADTDYTTSETLTYSSSTSNIADFSIDVVNGDLYILDNVNKKIYIENKSNEISNISNFQNYNETDITPINNQLEIAIVTKNTIAYNYPYTISPNSIIEEDQKVYIINKDYNFYLCLITNKENYNILLYLNSENLSILQIENDIKNIAISTTTAPVYKFPSSLNVNIDTQKPLRLDLSISSEDTLTAYRLINSPLDKFGKSFYEVKFSDNTYGYIDSSIAYVKEITESTNPTTPDLQTNAYLISGDDKQIELYQLENNEYIKTEISIDKNTKIQIDKNNFNVNSEYTKIKFIKDNEIITAYVKTINVRIDGVKIEIIVASILSGLCIILAITLIFFVRKNKNKMR